jgi:hypothetical protein
MVGSIRDLGRYLGRIPTLLEVIDYLECSLDELLKRGLWSQLLAEAGLVEAPKDPDQKRLAKGLHRLCHVDWPYQIRTWLTNLNGVSVPSSIDEGRLIEMLHVTLWGEVSQQWSIETAAERLSRNPTVVKDLRTVLEYQLQHAPAHHAGQIPHLSGPLTIHSQYTRDEILVGLGHWSLSRRPDQREGVLHIASSKVDAFFVTLQKTEEDYSPTTMYEDYLISHDQFHWQSQSNTSAESPTGRRYIHHQQMGYTPLLFVRETKNRPSGLAAPYVYLGPCVYLSHSGSRPISIVWRLLHPVPARLCRQMARQATA